MGIIAAHLHLVMGGPEPVLILSYPLDRSRDPVFQGDCRPICLSPGTVKSPMGEQVPGQVYETLIDPEDIAKTVDYLVSMDGNVVTEEIRMSRMFVRVPGAKG